MTMKHPKKMTPDEWAAWKAQAEYQARKLREYATRRPGARERQEGMKD